MVHGQQRACMPVYIGKSGDLVGWHRCLTHSLTHSQTEYRATQLLSSIQFKLSHAITFDGNIMCYWQLDMLQANQLVSHQYEHLALTDCRGEDSEVVCWSSYGPHNTLFQCKHWIITPPGARDRYQLISGGSFINNVVFEFWIMNINFISEIVPFHTLQMKQPDLDW